MHMIVVLVAALSVACQGQIQSAAVESGSLQGSHAEESVADLRKLIHEAQTALSALQQGIARHSSLLDGLTAPAQHDPGGCHVPEEKQKAGPASHVVLAKHQPSWQDFMRLLMVVQLGAEPTALHLLHRRTPGGHRQALLASGDALGRLQVHTLSGELLAMQATGGGALTAITAYPSPDGATTMLALGFLAGKVQMVHLPHNSSDLVPSWSSRPPLADSHNTGPQCNTDDLLGSPAVRHLVLLKASLRMHNLAVVHDNGAVQLLRDNGTLRAETNVPEPVHAVRAVGNTLHLVTSKSSGAIRLRGGRLNLQFRPLQGLNGSVITSAAFDEIIQHRAYAGVDGADIVMLHLLMPTGPRITVAKHRVPVPFSTSASALHHLRGHLLLLTDARAAILNTSSNMMLSAGPVPVCEQALGSLVAAANQQEVRRQGVPLIAAEDDLIAVTLPGGFMAVYEARLPFKAPLNLHLTQWTRPLFVLTMLVVGVWQYKRSRVRRMTLEDDELNVPPEWRTGRRSGYAEGSAGMTRAAFKQDLRSLEKQLHGQARAGEEDSSEEDPASLRATSIERLQTAGGLTTGRPSSLRQDITSQDLAAIDRAIFGSSPHARRH